MYIYELKVLFMLNIFIYTIIVYYTILQVIFCFHTWLKIFDICKFI